MQFSINMLHLNRNLYLFQLFVRCFCTSTNIISFLKSHFSFSTLSPPSRFCFPNSTRPLSLTWPNLMCQISVFDKGFVDATFVKPLTTSASRVYKPCFFTPLKTSFEPFMTLRIFFSPWKTYPFLSNSPRESRFLFKSGTYLTSVNNLIDSSWSLNLTDPIPAILQALLFPSNTDPPS